MTSHHMTNTSIMPLRSVCLLITDGKHGDCQPEDNSGYYFLSAKDVRDGKLIYKNSRQITKDDFFQTHRRTQFEPLDILIVSTGATIGRMAIASDNGFTGRTTFQKSVAILKPDKLLVSPHWLYYKLIQVNDLLVNMSGGTAQGNLLLRDLRNFEVEIPPLPVQHRIASLLSNFDNLIDVNTRRIHIYEEIAQTIYREWFRKVCRQSLPKGWEYRSITDVTDIRLINENVFPFKGEKKYFATGDVEGTRFINPGISYTYKTKPSRAQKAPVNNSVWFARMRDTFKVIVFSEANRIFAEKIILSSGFVGFEASIGWLSYLYFTINTKEFHEQKNQFCTGATQVSLTNEGLRRIKILVPAENIVHRFDNLVYPTINLILKLQQENVILRQMRDLLLPRLLSGEIDVSEMNILGG